MKWAPLRHPARPTLTPTARSGRWPSCRSSSARHREPVSRRPKARIWRPWTSTTSGIRFGIFSRMPTLGCPLPLIVTLISNFGTFLLYMTTCIVAIVAFKEHHMFNGHQALRHFRSSESWRTSCACCSIWSDPFPTRPVSVAGMSYKSPISPSASPRSGASMVVFFVSGSKAKGREGIP